MHVKELRFQILEIKKTAFCQKFKSILILKVSLGENLKLYFESIAIYIIKKIAFGKII
jgi:hypothetical protein